jgi:hypothetical protein
MPDPIYNNDPDALKTRPMYDLSARLQQVKETMASNRFAQGWSDALPTVTVTGTAITGGVAEAEIVSGGQTLIFTLSTGTWGTTMATHATTLNTALNGSASGAGSWDDEIVLSGTDIVRTTSTVLTVTLPAAASYSISGDETVTFELPYTMLLFNGVAWTSTSTMTASPTTFVITNA